MEDYYMPIYVRLIENKYRYEETDKLPAHELVIRPLFENSLETLVYKGRKDDFFLYGKMNYPIKLEQEDILVPDKGKFRFDKTKECITGHEYLWNAHTGKRGSIVLVLENNFDIFRKIFKHTYNPDLTETPNTGNTVSAIKKCKEEMGKGNIAICLSLSNGMEHMQIYVGQGKTNELLKIAEDSCQRVDTKAQALRSLEEMKIKQIE